MAKNLSYCHLALIMGIATALVQSWENDTGYPNDQQLKFLANLFGITPPKEGAFIAPISARQPEK